MKDQKGFTLVELIIIVAMLGVLAAVAVPNYVNYLYTSRINTDITTARELARSAQTYCGTHGLTSLPEDFEEAVLEVVRIPDSCADGGRYEYTLADNNITVSFVADSSKVGKYAGTYRVRAYGDLPSPLVGGMNEQ